MRSKGVFYFSPSEQDLKWGIYGTGAGHGDYQPGVAAARKKWSMLSERIR